MESNMQEWLSIYVQEMKNQFGNRIKFIGLQENQEEQRQQEHSTYYVVVILDQVTFGDLKQYEALLDTLETREAISGFISGQQELLFWEPSDLFIFYYDTIPIEGSLDFLLPLISREDIRRAIRMGACHLYRKSGHNLIHEKSESVLRSLYKSATFTLQAIHYERTGEYISQNSLLLARLPLGERNILNTYLQQSQQPDLFASYFDTCSQQLFLWAADLIADYRHK